MESLIESLNRAFAGMELEAKDEPAKNLARIYAEAIEKARDNKSLKDLGSELLRVLEALQMTPKSRAVISQNIKEVAENDDSTATFSELRSNNGVRARRAAQVDTAAP